MILTQVLKTQQLSYKKKKKICSKSVSAIEKGKKKPLTGFLSSLQFTQRVKAESVLAKKFLVKILRSSFFLLIGG